MEWSGAWQGRRQGWVELEARQQALGKTLALSRPPKLAEQACMHASTPALVRPCLAARVARPAAGHPAATWRSPVAHQQDFAVGGEADAEGADHVLVLRARFGEREEQGEGVVKGILPSPRPYLESV